MKYVITGDTPTDSWQVIRIPDGAEQYFDSELRWLLPGIGRPAATIPAPQGFSDFSKCGGLLSRYPGQLPKRAYLSTRTLTPGPIPKWWKEKEDIRKKLFFSDFGFAWGVLATVVVAAINAYGNRKGNAGATTQFSSGWDAMIADLAAHGVTFENPKFAFCCCEKGGCYRVHINSSGQIEVAPRGETGANPRIDCRCLIPDAFAAIGNCGSIPEGYGCQGGYVKQGVNTRGGASGGGSGDIWGDPGGIAGAAWWSKYGIWVAVGGIGLMVVIGQMSKKR